jgi:hypothetical protein
VQFGVDGADEFCVGVGLVGLGPVADEVLAVRLVPDLVFVVRHWF